MTEAGGIMAPVADAAIAVTLLARRSVWKNPL